jgi:xanthine dehydrogenase YagS FAD-binding subunit
MISVASAALQAQVVVAGPSGTRPVKIQDFFAGPDKSIEKENILAVDEIVTEVQLPQVAGSIRSSYRKIRARQAWDFALVSVACVLQFDNQNVTGGRIFLGGVGPYPWRAEGAEKAVIGKKIDGALAAAAGTSAAAGASPLRDNAYKVDMVKGAVEESVLAFA